MAERITKSRNRFRDLVDLYTDTATANDPNPSHTIAKKNEPCEIVEVRGGERIRGRTIEAHVDAVITMRKHADTEVLTAKDRLVGASPPYDSVVYEIDARILQRVGARNFDLVFDCVRTN